MKLTKEQKTILSLIGLTILAYILYKRSKSSKSEESGLTQEETTNQVAMAVAGISALNDVKANMLDGGILNDKWTNIGNDFFIPPGNSKRMAKKYIDGTVQYGYLINDNNQYRGGEEEDVVVGNKAGVDIIIKQKKYIAIPSDKGFTKNDGRGNYFYFEELPEWKKVEIKKLEDLKAAAEKAEAEAKAKALADAKSREEANRKAKEEKMKFELAKQESERKALESRLLAKKQEREIELAKEKSKKNTMIIVVLLIVGVVGFFVWKNYKK